MDFTFRLYGVSLEAVEESAPIIEDIAKHDPDLARQARRAVTSMHLNLAEGMDALGGNRRVRFRSSLGSTNEVIACLDIAQALGYAKVGEGLRDRLQRMRATLLKLVRARR